MDFNRRDFLKVLGGTAVGVLTTSGEVLAVDEGADHSGHSIYGLLNDGTKCIGCHSCEVACREYNNLPDPETGPDGEIIYPTELNNDIYTRIESRTIQSPESPDTDLQTFRRHMCNHCEDPSCASACPVGALIKSPEGPVYYKPERCIGCRYCVLACPFSIPKYDWETWKPFVHKCTMCYDKVKNGEPTSCASACPVGAIKFGLRDDLIGEAYARMMQEPERYQKHIYGENEIGGLSVLTLSTSAIPLDEFGFRTDLGTESFPMLSWSALSRVPGISIYVAVWLTLVYFITHRRMPEEIGQDKTSDQTLD